MDKKEQAIENQDRAYSLCQNNLPINEVAAQMEISEAEVWRLINKKAARLTKIKTKSDDALDLKIVDGEIIEKDTNVKNECCECGHIWFSNTEHESCPNCGEGAA